jgi:hypothetical protein
MLHHSLQKSQGNKNSIVAIDHDLMAAARDTPGGQE